ncbi:MAG: TA system VapC family ribonuclease toxin [Thermoanaerobaculia bacterium]
MVSLLDVNVLVALAWPVHEHHERATQWFRRNQRAGWATCPLTQSGFVRVSSNLKVTLDAKSPREAIVALRRILALPHHVFFSDDISLVRSQFVDPEKLSGHRQVTDAHLLGIALRHDGRLATLDRGVFDLVPSAFPASEAVCWLGAGP